MTEKQLLHLSSIEHKILELEKDRLWFRQYPSEYWEVERIKRKILVLMNKYDTYENLYIQGVIYEGKKI